MMERCYNLKTRCYADYGGRGITVYERWHTVENFLQDMGARPSKQHSIERRENNGNYEPGNCYWTTSMQQGANKRNNRFVQVGTRQLTVATAAREFGIKYSTLHKRITRYGMPDAAACGVEA